MKRIGMNALLLTALVSGTATVAQEATRFAFFPEQTRWVFKAPFGALLGVSYLSSTALVMSSVVPCQGFGDCPVDVGICEPVVLLKQKGEKTVIVRGNWKATDRSGLSSKTFFDRAQCEEAAGIEPTGSVGLSVSPDMVIALVVPGGPASEAGVIAGRRLLRVAGQEVGSPKEALSLIQGLPGTEVEIVAGRMGNETSYLLKRKPWSEVYASPGQ